MPKIRLKLNTESIDKALNELNTYKNKVTLTDYTVPQLISTRLKPRLENNISHVWVEELMPGHINDRIDYFVVDQVDRDNGSVLVYGTDAGDLVFAEFGAGVYFNGSPGSSPHPKGKELGMTIGDYGRRQGRKPQWKIEYSGVDLARNGMWSRGTRAQMPFWNAAQETREEIPELVSELFKYG